MKKARLFSPQANEPSFAHFGKRQAELSGMYWDVDEQRARSHKTAQMLFYGTPSQCAFLSASHQAQRKGWAELAAKRLFAAAQSIEA